MPSQALLWCGFGAILISGRSMFVVLRRSGIDIGFLSKSSPPTFVQLGRQLGGGQSVGETTSDDYGQPHCGSKVFRGTAHVFSISSQ